MRVIVERNRRVGVRSPVEFWRDGALVCTETEDLSEHGVFVRSEAFFPRGHVVDLQFRQPTGACVRQPARVAHILPQGMARVLGRRAGMGFEFCGTPCAEILEMLRRAEEELSSPAVAGPRKCSVLVADASLPIFERLATTLGAAGHDLRTAVTGREALASCRQARPDVLLIDVDLQDMTAWELIDTLANDPALASIPVGVMGPSGDDDARLKAYRRGATDFVPKPFTDEEIGVRVARLALRAPASEPHAGLSGELSVLGLPTLLSMFDYDHKSGTLCIERQSEVRRLFVAGGRVVRIESTIEGEPLRNLLETLDWNEGTFRFDAGEIICEDQINLPTQHLLLEHARHRDEASEEEEDGELDMDGAFAEVEGF